MNNLYWKPLWGLFWVSVIGFLIWMMAMLTMGKPPSGHGHRPTPTPSPSVTPTPSPSATPIPLPPPPSVTLAWGPSAPSTDPATGYHFHWGFTSGAESNSVDVGNTLTYTLQLTSGQIYFFIVTAYDVQNNESSPSNEVSYIAP